MSRAAVLRAGLLLLAAAGCVHDVSLIRPWGAGRYTRTVPAAPPRVASVLEAGFSGCGVMVLVKRQDDEIRLVGRTKANEVFCAHVRPEKATAARSSITVEWDGQPDEELWGALLEWLTTFPPEGEGTADGRG
jgi:hypothetical protein